MAAIFVACLVVRSCSSRACRIVVIVVILWPSCLCVVCLCDDGSCRHDVSSGMKLDVDIVFRSLQAYVLMQHQALLSTCFLTR